MSKKTLLELYMKKKKSTYPNQNIKKEKNSKFENESLLTGGAIILIRKYDNRRLYCVNQKSYINLDDISGYISDGGKIKVMEVATGKDITSEILLQILLQQGKADLIPLEVLEVMVRMSNTWLRKFWSPYFEKSFRMVFELNPLLNPRLNSAAKDIFKNWF